MILPQLAVRIGLNEAIILQQIHYWTRDNRHVIDGLSWTYNTVEEWNAQFPFWSSSTIRRTVDSLIDQGFVVKRKLSQNKFDATLWYAIDRGSLASTGEQIDLLNLSKSDSQNEQIRSAQNEQITSTKTTTKTTTKTDKGTHLPEDWIPSDEDIEFCKQERPDLDPEKVSEEFRDYWIAKPGKEGRKTNWSATWRNWVRRQRQQDVKPEIKPKEQAWWASDQGILAKAAQIGLTPRSGESWHALKGRINQRLGQ